MRVTKTPLAILLLCISLSLPAMTSSTPGSGITRCLILGFGIWLQFMGQVAMLPGEAMNRAISTVTGKKYENIKILFDVLYIAAAVILGFVFLGGLKGVREGSIIAAVAIGNIIKIYNRLWEKATRRSKSE